MSSGETATEQEPASVVSGVVLALSAAAFAFMGLLWPYLSGGISEKEESRVFVLSCLVVPLAGVLASVGFEGLRRRVFRDDPLFVPVLTLAHAVFWLFAVRHLRNVLPPPRTGAAIDLRPVFRSLLGGYALGNAALVALLAATRTAARDQTDVAWFGRWVDRALPFLLFAALLPFTLRTAQPRSVIVLLTIAGFGSFVHPELERLPRAFSARLAVDGLVVALIAGLLFDAAGDVYPFHSNFYLGPVAAIRAGKSLLVDVNCQYGVGSIYFIGAMANLRLFAPSLAGFGALTCALAVVQHTLHYAALRMITRSVALSVLIVGLIVVVPSFEQMDFMTTYPSSGAIRFLPGTVFVFCVALRGRFPLERSMISIMEAVVVGGSSIWSFEAFVYVFVAFLGSFVYEVAHARRGEILREVEARLLPVLIAISGFHSTLAIVTRYRSGEWPHWARYLDYIRLYSVQEFGSLPVEPWTPWLLIGGACAATVIALGYRRVTLGKRDLKPGYSVVFAMSSLGIAQFTYYVGRSHSNNLFHIAFPAIFVAGYWLVRVARDTSGVSRAFSKSFAFVGYAGATLLAVSAFPDLAHKFDHTLLSYIITNRDPVSRPPAQKSVDAAALMARYAPNARQVAFFSSADIEVETFLLAGKASLWPMAYQRQDELLPSAKARIFAWKAPLKVGDVIFADIGKVNPAVPLELKLAPDADGVFDRILWNGMTSRFGLEVVEVRASGVAALRLNDGTR